MSELIEQLKALDAGATGETYAKPEHGWTCFHCGDTFTTFGAARDHFGFDPSADPACKIKLGAERGLLMALRKAEKELADAWSAIHDESTEAAKAYYAQQSRHRQQLMAAEESGYERGLSDVTAMSEELEAVKAGAERLAEALGAKPWPPSEADLREMLAAVIEAWWSPSSANLLRQGKTTREDIKGMYAIRDALAPYVSRAALEEPKQ